MVFLKNRDQGVKTPLGERLAEGWGKGSVPTLSFKLKKKSLLGTASQPLRSASRGSKFFLAILPCDHFFLFFPPQLKIRLYSASEIRTKASRPVTVLLQG